MIINSVSPFSAGRMCVGGRTVGRIDTVGAGLSIGSVSGGPGQDVKKTSIYDNFSKEMSRRLNQARRSGLTDPDDAPDPAVLVQSLTGAMGEVEQLFGREAATEVMAKILTGTAGGVDEESLINSIQGGLAGLSRFDPNGANLTRLTEGFNRDLTLALDPEAADQKVAAKETFSLSYALSRHFGSLLVPEEGAARAADPEAEAAVAERPDGPIIVESLQAEASFKAIGLGGAVSFDPGDVSVLEKEAPTRMARQGQPVEIVHETFGFDATGRWDMVRVTQLDDAATEALQEAAEAGLDRVEELELAAIIEQYGAGQKIFEEMSTFLKDKLQDEESAAFVDHCIEEALEKIANKYGDSIEMSTMIGQVYSKVAAEGDADKLVQLENYLNTEFKEAINPALAEFQKGNLPILAGGEVGELQFKGIIGASLAGENDNFGLKWGYKDEDTFDRTTTKRFLQEDIREVKEVKEQQERAEQRAEVNIWAETVEARLTREAKESQARRKARSGREEAAETPAATPVYKGAEMAEEFAAERRQDQLTEAMTTRFGQLSDDSRAKLEQYVKDHFSEEEAEKLLERATWSNELMSGLAAMHRDILASGEDGDKAADFLKFLNSELKTEVEKIADRLGGLNFDGWRASDDLSGTLEAAFHFSGRSETVRVLILDEAQAAPAEEGFPEPSADVAGILRPAPDQAAEADRAPWAPPAYFQRLQGTGYLVNLLA